MDTFNRKYKEAIISKFKVNNTTIDNKDINQDKCHNSLNNNYSTNSNNNYNDFRINNDDEMNDDEMNDANINKYHDNNDKENDIQDFHNIPKNNFKNSNNNYRDPLTYRSNKNVSNNYNINYENEPQIKKNTIQRYKSLDDDNKFYYCGKINELIKCECCPDHICKKGNCFCVKCMRKNLYKLNLVNGELINRAGKVAKFIKGNYYCGSQYESIFENINHITFRNTTKCEYPSVSCNNCKVLNKFRNIYYDIK